MAVKLPGNKKTLSDLGKLTRKTQELIHKEEIFCRGYVKDQKITDRYAIYNGDCIEGMKALKPESVHFSIYSPPFCGLYHYSSDDRDLSNCADYKSFFEHYAFVVREKFRVTMPGRLSAVHCCDIPSGNSGGDYLKDFPGDIIRLHEAEGWVLKARHGIWKEPLMVRNRTMAKDLAHKTIVEDSAQSGVAGMDQLLIFRRDGKNKVPIAHPTGLHEYAGATPIPQNLLRFKCYNGDQTKNLYSHWIWRRYASSFWDDIRIDRVLPFRDGRTEEDEKHVHPLQLDVIHRAIVLRSNPGEIVLTPFMGVGSEVYEALNCNRRAIGFELKESYFRQAIKNIDAVEQPKYENQDMFGSIEIGVGEDEENFDQYPFF